MSELSIIHTHAILSTVFEPVLSRFTPSGGGPTDDPFSWRGG